MIMAESDPTRTALGQTSDQSNDLISSDSQHIGHDASRLLKQRLELVEDLWKTV